MAIVKLGPCCMAVQYVPAQLAPPTIPSRCTCCESRRDIATGNSSYSSPTPAMEITDAFYYCIPSCARAILGVHADIFQRIHEHAVWPAA